MHPRARPYSDLRICFLSLFCNSSKGKKFAKGLKIQCSPSKVHMMEARQNDFKWFGEGFDGFPKHLPEDCVEYVLYIIDSKLSDSEIRSQLRKIQASASNLIKKLLKGYIWQRQSFQLELIHNNGNIFATIFAHSRGLELNIPSMQG